MYENYHISLRQLLRYGLLIGAVIVVGLVIWFTYTHGGINIKTESGTAEISIAPDKNQVSVAAKATGKSLFTILKNGRYIVTVKDGQKQTRTAVIVSSFNVKEISLTPPEIKFSEAVTNISLSSFAVSSSNLSFLDSAQGEIAFIDSNNIYQHTDISVTYDSVVWSRAGDGYGVGRKLGTDERVLMKITDNKPGVASTPAPITPETYLAFGFSSDGYFYIMQDGTLYRTKGDGNYQSVGNTNRQASIVSINAHYATFLYRDREEKCEIQFLNLTSKIIVKKSVECIQDPSYIYSSQWSADGKQLALTTGKSLEILDEKLVVQSTIPDYLATSPLWLTSDTLVYISRNSVWSYTGSSGTSSVIATTPEYIDVQMLQKADDSDELYFSGVIDDQSTLYRVSARGDALRDIQMLSESNMQILSTVCRIHYVNFTKPQIVLTTATVTRSQCDSETKSYLSSIKTSIDSFQYDIREEFGYTDYLNEPAN